MFLRLERPKTLKRRRSCNAAGAESRPPYFLSHQDRFISVVAPAIVAPAIRGIPMSYATFLNSDSSAARTLARVSREYVKRPFCAIDPSYDSALRIRQFAWPGREFLLGKRIDHRGCLEPFGHFGCPGLHKMLPQIEARESRRLFGFKSSFGAAGENNGADQTARKSLCAMNRTPAPRLDCLGTPRRSIPTSVPV